MNNITGLTIANFKGIRDPVSIPIKPITLLFGANSAGKSAILQSLIYAREVIERRNANPDTTLMCGEALDLGGFWNLVYNHDISRDILIKITINANNLPNTGHISHYDDKKEENVSEEIPIPNRININKLIVVKSLSIQITTGIVGGAILPKTNSVFINDQEVCTAKCDEYYMYQLDNKGLNYEHPLIKALFNKNPKLKIFIDDIFHLSGAIWIHKTPACEEMLYNTENVNIANYEIEADDYPKGFNEDGTKLKPIPDNIFYNLQLFFEQLLGIGRLVASKLADSIYLGPIRNIPPRQPSVPEKTSNKRWYTGLSAWDVIYGSLLRKGPDYKSTIRPTRNWGKDKEKVIGIFDDKLNKVLDDKLFNDVNYWLSEKGLDTGFCFKMIHEISLRSGDEVLKAINKYHDQHDVKGGVDYDKDIWAALCNKPTNAVLCLFDKHSITEVTPSDIGCGISQVIPVIVAALSYGKRVVIEQPELHLHPAAQCALGDLFATAIKSEHNKTQFVLETHSEHLMLRLQKLIRKKDLKAEDVCVLYVSREKEGSRVQQLRLDDEGSFIDRWPKGFFPERTNEILD